jgi:hypothetical protein
MKSIFNKSTMMLALSGLAATSAFAQSNEKPATIHGGITYLVAGVQDCDRINSDFSSGRDNASLTTTSPATLIMDFIHCGTDIFSVLKMNGTLVTVHQNDMNIIPQPAPTSPPLPDDTAPETKPIATLNGLAGWIDGWVNGSEDNCQPFIDGMANCSHWTPENQDMQIQIEHEFHCADGHTYYHVDVTVGGQALQWTVRDSNVFYTRPGTDH